MAKENDGKKLSPWDHYCIIHLINIEARVLFIFSHDYDVLTVLLFKPLTLMFKFLASKIFSQMK